MSLLGAEMKLTQEILPKYFSIADCESSWYKEPTNTFDFIGRDSQCLLVTIGDSWTYGDKLLNRLDEVYGRLIANELKSDWLNLGLCAQGNFWIASMVEEFSKIINQLEYDKIYVICVFTGVGRWFNTKYDNYIDYITWFKENIHQPNDFDLLIPWLNDQCVQRILTALEPFKQVQLKIGTNFLDHTGLTRLSNNQLLPQPWYRIMNCSVDELVYTCVYSERI